MAVKIRQAKIADSRRIVELGKLAVEESPVYREFGVSERKVKQLLISMICTKSDYVGVIDRGGSVDGFLMGLVDEAPFSKHRQANDWALYCTPEASGHMPLLIRDFLGWGWTQKGVVMVGLSSSAGIHIEKTEALYSKMGLSRIGGIWLDRYPPGG